VVGVGITGVPQTTPEAAAFMSRAERLFYLVLDPLTATWIRRLNPTAVSLADAYAPGKPRRQTYAEITRRITQPVFDGQEVCAAFYGHPGVLVLPSRAAVRAVRRAGLPAVVVPGISAEACLYADLDLDPGTAGVQSYEATDFLLYRRRFDPTSALILWQIGVLGDAVTRAVGEPYRADRMAVLVRRLLRQYPPRHRVTVYEAATFPGAKPQIRRVPLERLARTAITPISTLYIPALPPREPDARIIEWMTLPSARQTLTGAVGRAARSARHPGA
jgi:hypothetical protein